MSQQNALLDRLMRKVGSDGDCWLWRARSLANGYGRMKVQGRMVLAHRLSYELHIGPIPAGMCVCHRCDVRLCVNPGHLFLGTQTDNVADAVRKGRYASGEASGSAKLSDAQARRVILLRAAGAPRRAVAARFGISQQQVRRIANGYSRKELHK